ncbi:hypothetical protein [Psychrobacter pygoscelis]|uniref:hypothetical protein n=1 Tax=Psychrobacter pygoscelis TaxID=2488563 RepID=UPI00103EC5A6|nr:hypothetical protein [Psychrobacter pygoscelis]
MSDFAKSCLLTITALTLFIVIYQLLGDALDKSFASNDAVVEHHKAYISPSDQLVISWNDNSSK